VTFRSSSDDQGRTPPRSQTYVSELMREQTQLPEMVGFVRKHYDTASTPTGQGEAQPSLR
jgi:hypothetical protein